MSTNRPSVRRASVLALMAVAHLSAGVGTVRGGDVAPPPSAVAPAVTITSPENGSVFPEGTAITFTGIAYDPQEGDLSHDIEWWSSLDGDLGTGEEVSPAPLSPGIHTVTASVTDDDGFTGTDHITVSILPDCQGVLYEATFEAGDDGFFDGASTCEAGTFVRGIPDPEVSGGVTTQPDGAAEGAYAWFTQPNPGGPDDVDVDGGTCETLTRPIEVGAGAWIAVFVDYFHGQRDRGDDPHDGFTIELVDAGTGHVLDTLVSIGDVTHQAVWTSTFSVFGWTPESVLLRVRVTDGPAAGDVIEAGIDNVVMCSIPPPRQGPIG